MTLAAAAFFFACACIVALFSLKAWEGRSGRVLLPRARADLDARAISLKARMIALRLRLAAVLPAAVFLSRFLLREAALFAALAARAAERRAYRVADAVSYKHRFEKRETRSEFLRKVTEHKNGGSLRSEGPDA